MIRRFLNSFESRTALETPQIVLTWEFNESLFPLIQSFQIVRSETVWPRTAAEGNIVLSGFPTSLSGNFADIGIDPDRLYYYTMIIQWRDAQLSKERYREIDGHLAGGFPITDHFAFSPSYPGTVVGVARVYRGPLTGTYDGLLAIAVIDSDGTSSILFWRMDTGFVEYRMELGGILAAGDAISSIAWCGRIGSDPGRAIITTKRFQLIHFSYPNNLSIPTDDPGAGDIISSYDLRIQLGLQIYPDPPYPPGSKFRDFNIVDSAIEWGVYKTAGLLGNNGIGYSKGITSDSAVPTLVYIRETTGDTIIAVDNGSGGFTGIGPWVVSSGTITYAQTVISNLKFTVDPGALAVDYVYPTFGSGALNYLLLDGLRNRVYRLSFADGEYYDDSDFPFETVLNPDQNVGGDNLIGYNQVLDNSTILPGTVVLRRTLDNQVVAIDDGLGGFIGRNGWPIYGGVITYTNATISNLQFALDEEPPDFTTKNPGILTVEYAIGHFTAIASVWTGTVYRVGVSFWEDTQGYAKTQILEFPAANNDPYENPGALLRTYLTEPISGLFYRVASLVYLYQSVTADGLVQLWQAQSASSNVNYSFWLYHKTQAFSGREYVEGEFSFRDNLYDYISDSMRFRDHTPKFLNLTALDDGELVHRNVPYSKKQLERLLRMFGLLIDRAVDYRNFFQNHLDPELCDPRWLTSLAMHFGIADLDPNWPLDRQRIYMQLRPLINQKKGTLSAMELLIKFFGFEFAAASTRIIVGRQTFDSWDTATPIPFDSGGIFDTFGGFFEVLFQIRLRRIIDLEEVPSYDPIVEFIIDRLNQIKPFNVTIEYV